ncbi:MAG: LysM peptidoglycan-binding domain-containing protein [Pseudomonadales bacterium]|jgi:LysM repeat protein|nr:LysM peptidoglycan-binding domain-containing protein [Pseudomonadales bacterium]
MDKVRGGDTLGSIAKSFGVSVVSIQESNRLSGTVIYPDPELTIHSATSTHLEPAAPAPAATAQQNLRNYEVRPGDTLSNIANRFGLSVEAIKQRNALPDGTVHVGQNLLIY